MDESERRRERLKAMRDEAAKGEVLAGSQMSGLQSGLANPLTDASSLQEVSRSETPRFDYYTDPVASFSGTRRGNVGSLVQQGFVPNHGYVRAPPVRHMPPSTEPWNPMMSMRPFPGPRAYQAQPGGHFNGSMPYRTPVSAENRYIPHREMPPGVGNQPGGAVPYHPQPNFPRGANFFSPGGRSGMGDFRGGYGRGQSFQGSYSGRGRGNWTENNVRMGSEQSSSRNQGSASPVPKSLYAKFMVEDPWKSLKPSIWQEEAPDVSLPPTKTVGVKRPLENYGPSIPSSQSLAEYLADSFDEAVKGDPGV